MRIESIARKTPGLKRHCVKTVKEKYGYLVISLKPDKRLKLLCSHCGAKAPGYDTLKERQWKHAPVWGIPVLLIYAPRRIKCKNCWGKVEAIPWTQGKSPLSLPLSVFLASWAKIVAWKVVGKLSGNGLVEGLNNKATVISHRAYGYRSAETFKLALLPGLGNLPEPNLTLRFL